MSVIVRKASRFGRRALLRGAGGAAIALPLLHATSPRRAGAAAPPRFLVVFTPGGTVMENWAPKGTETTFTLGPILAALEPWKQHLVIPQGLDMHQLARASTGDGNHGNGVQALLTGANCTGFNFAQGPSLDQVLAPTLSAGCKFRSLEMAVRFGTGKAANGGKPHHQSTITLEAAGKPIPPQTSPDLVFQRLFTDLSVDPAIAARERARGKSILDDVTRQYTSVMAKLGAEDRAKLEAHLTKLRELEAGLGAGAAPATGVCTKPTLGETTGFNADANIPRTGKQMMDMMVMAFACGLTRVGTLQWTDSEAKHTFPWLNLLENHHGYQHDRGYQPEALTKIYTWYAGQFEYLLRRLAEVKEPDGSSLLDNTLVFWGSEISHPGNHNKANMPFLLAGGAGGRLKTGRWLKFATRPHNDLLVSILNVLGNPAKTFGNPAFCTGALPGLA